MENLEQFEELNTTSFDLETIFKFCPDGIVCKDRNLNYINANKNYIESFSFNDFKSIYGKKINPHLSNNLMKLISDAAEEVKNSCSPINYVLNLENNKLLNITTFPILDKKIFSGLVSIIRDITQEEAMKEEFVNKHFEYINSEKNLQAQRETFVASIGHDLKNPTLAQIRSLELLLNGVFGKFNNEQKEILSMILDSCKYMNGMLSSLLATYRNYGGAIKLNFETFSFTDLLKECVSEMLYVAKDKDIIINNIFESTIYIFADKVQIKRVIMNLLSNGIKYAFKYSELKLITLCKDDKLFFKFENKSPYISEERQKALFKQYVSYAGTHKELGIGLGLYASKKIIEAHNGNIFVKSYKKDRNIFWFEIPLTQDTSNIKEVQF